MDASLRTRLISIAVFLPVVLFALYLGPVSFALLLGVTVLFGGWELGYLLGKIGWRAPRFLPLAAAAVFVLSLYGRWGPAEFVLAPVAVLLPLLWLSRPMVPRERAGAFVSWTVHLLGALYLGLLLACLARVQAWPGGWTRGLGSPGARRVLLVLLVTWACDIGAYCFGRLFGRHRLWPEVSPRKTWEGALGGFAVTILVCLALAKPLGDLPPSRALLLGALAGILAQLGDLAESRLKRVAGVKDSGNLIPGHGGMLDRLDSLLLVAPVFYYGLNGWKF